MAEEQNTKRSKRNAKLEDVQVALNCTVEEHPVKVWAVWLLLGACSQSPNEEHVCFVGA